MTNSKVYALVMFHTYKDTEVEQESIMGIYKSKEDAVVALMVCVLSELSGDTGETIPDTKVEFYQPSGGWFSMDEHRGSCVPPDIEKGVVEYDNVHREYYISEHSVK